MTTKHSGNPEANSRTEKKDIGGINGEIQIKSGISLI